MIFNGRIHVTARYGSRNPGIVKNLRSHENFNAKGCRGVMEALGVLGQGLSLRTEFKF